MAANDDDQLGIDPATYAELYTLDDTYESVDAVVAAFQEALCQPIHKRRADLAKRIPNFWPLVFEQAPPEVDQWIQPSDSQVIASCLTGFSVDRFESKSTPDVFASLLKAGNDDIDEGQCGEPRSLRIRFEFKENEWFTDTVLEKKFWFRRSIESDDEEAPVRSGRISEPVKIHWKPGKDLSEGLTDAVCAFWEALKSKKLLEAKNHKDSKEKDEEIKKLAEYQALVERVESSSEGGQSFFTWFSYHGQWVTSAQDKAAKEREKHQKKNPPTDAGASQANGGAKENEDDLEEDDDLGEVSAQLAAEMFHEGEDLALALAEDIFPNAVEYYLEAQEDEDDEMSDGSFDEADLEEIDEEDLKRANMEEIKGLAGRIKTDENGAPSPKKRKT